MLKISPTIYSPTENGICNCLPIYYFAMKNQNVC